MNRRLIASPATRPRGNPGPRMHTLTRTSPGRARSNGRGFSLIELIVVIIIIAIVARVAISTMGNSRQARQRNPAAMFTL